MCRVFWDSNLYFYLVENCGVFSRKVQELRAKMLVRGDQLLTSRWGEILVKPTEAGRPRALRAIRECSCVYVAADSV
jgi:hypothetical protein